MSKVEDYIRATIEREGKYSDHPDDLGGPTKYGITEAVARENGYTGPMKDMPEAVAWNIYLAVYWEKPGFKRVAAIDGPVADELFDTGVNMHPTVASKFLQRCLNAFNRKAADWPDVAVDGHVGDKTIVALQSLKRCRGPEGMVVLLKGLNCLQGARYIELAEVREDNESFAYGWVRARVSLDGTEVA